MAVHVPRRDCEEIVHHEAGGRLELEGASQLPVHRLAAIVGRQLLVRQVDDAHRLRVGEGMSEAEDERFPEVAAEENVAEESSLDHLGSAPRAEIDEVVRRFDLPTREPEHSADGGAKVQSLRRHPRFGTAAESVEHREFSADVDVADVRARNRL